MGEVALTFRVMPEGPETDINKLKAEIKKKVNVKDIRENDIGFGLKQLEILLTFDDRKGSNTDEIEEKIRSIKGVASVESGDVTLI